MAEDMIELRQFAQLPPGSPQVDASISSDWSPLLYFDFFVLTAVSLSPHVRTQKRSDTLFFRGAPEMKS